MAAPRKPPPLRMTVAGFLAGGPGDTSGRRWQLIDGEPAAMEPVSENRRSIQAELSGRLWPHLAGQGRRSRVVTEPGIVLRGPPNRNFRIPGIGVTCAPSSAGQMLPDPILLIEILSPFNGAETRSNIGTYMSNLTVTEILIVNETRVEAELPRRGVDGTSPEPPPWPAAGETLALDCIGFTASAIDLHNNTALAQPGGRPP